MKATGFQKVIEFTGKSTWFKVCKIGLMFGASAWLVYSMFSASLKSEWSLVDDQEIVYYLGSDQKIEFAEAWDIYLNKTEIGKFGSYQRFRPAYFAFRL